MIKNELNQLKENIELCNKLQITPNDIFFINAILMSKENIYEKTILKEVCDILKKHNLSVRDMLIDYKNKGFISSDYIIPQVGEQLDVNKLEFTRTFIEAYEIVNKEAGKELWVTYPTYYTTNTANYQLKNISKHNQMDTLQKLYTYYWKSINSNLNTHKKVINLVNYGKQNNLINYGIIEFLASEKWEELNELKENGTKEMSFVELI